MFNLFSRWYRRRFSDPHAVTLFVILLAGFGVIYFGGTLLAPIFLSLVLAYLMEWPVFKLEQLGLSRALGATLSLLFLLGTILIVILVLVPLVWNQSVNLVEELPEMFEQLQLRLSGLQAAYPNYISDEQILLFNETVNEKLLVFGNEFLSISIKSLFSVVAFLVYAVVVPLLVFFFLKDKHELLGNMTRFLPDNRKLANEVWQEMNGQIMNYIRGKVTEIFIVGGVSFIFFEIIDLRYSALLGLLVGLSVLIPYIGAALVTLPIALVGLFQWGISSEFAWLMFGYGVIQGLDGNLLVPLLFSEAVNLHPAVIIIAVLVFGGLWGFWGVFFAIPLATLIKAVLNVWPVADVQQAETEGGSLPQK